MIAILNYPYKIKRFKLAGGIIGILSGLAIMGTWPFEISISNQSMFDATFFHITIIEEMLCSPPCPLYYSGGFFSGFMKPTLPTPVSFKIVVFFIYPFLGILAGFVYNKIEICQKKSRTT